MIFDTKNDIYFPYHIVYTNTIYFSFDFVRNVTKRNGYVWSKYKDTRDNTYTKETTPPAHWDIVYP